LRRLERVWGLDRPCHLPRLRLTPEARAVLAQGDRLARLAGARDLGEPAVWNGHPQLGPRIADLATRLLQLLAEANPRGNP
jgi:hypothetical protein